MAQVYDRLMEDAPYDRWVEFTDRMLKKFHPKAAAIIDLGCGTGEITHRLHKRGYHMTGIDLSSDMLTIAQQKDPKAPIAWHRQDMTSLSGFHDVDCIISYCDVINYVTEEDAVKDSFRHIHEALGKDGLFLFDVHSIEHIQQDLLGATFAEVYDDLSYVWFCDPGEKENSFVHDLTFFVQTNGLYNRFDEVHYQQGYQTEDLATWLKDAGFLLKGIYADFRKQPSQEGDRLLFVCQKESK
ncbi:class I SAM-dependent methyltransferase [Bacillus sp. SB49]|uniref:class I SAM-dependent DNA methyltransferase n=1 Tax=Bacillus sp. SB49 TaxID=1071080 RepID=UPI00040566ED|nr:class I SAM-dependent methyltransferase [Bacillus sp. SB49]QHT47223.1 class I SAM-dependent methyltransferase [Bacillus sp. SB49]